MSPVRVVLMGAGAFLVAAVVTVIMRAVLTTGQVCTCGHHWDCHEHHREGADCSFRGCWCARFQREWRWRA